MKNKRYVIVLIALVFVLTIWSILVINQVFDSIDRSITNGCYNIRGEKENAFYYILIVLTNLVTYGLVPIFIIAAVLLVLDLRYFMLLLDLVISVVFNSTIKLIVGRERPLEGMRWAVENSSSYPSGHSATATTLCVFMIFLLAQSKQSKKVKATGIVVLSIMPLIIMTTRLFLGVHYFSDVIGGMLQGSCAAILSMIIYNILSNTRFNGFRRLKDEDLEEIEEESTIK